MSRSRTMSVARMVAKKRTGSFAGDHLLQERPPLVLERRRVLVGERDEVDPVGAVQPLDLVRQLRRVAVPPLDPEAVLPAVGAAVGAAAQNCTIAARPSPKQP